MVVVSFLVQVGLAAHLAFKLVGVQSVQNETAYPACLENGAAVWTLIIGIEPTVGTFLAHQLFALTALCGLVDHVEAYLTGEEVVVGALFRV